MRKTILLSGALALMTLNASAEVALKSITPAGPEVASLKTFTLVFDGDNESPEEWTAGNMPVTILDASGNVYAQYPEAGQYPDMVSDDNYDGMYESLTFSLKNEITEKGSYTLVIPAGIVKTFGGSDTNAEARIPYTVTGNGGGETPDVPELGEVTFTVSVDNAAPIDAKEFNASGISLNFTDMGLLSKTSEVTFSDESGASYSAPLSTGVLAYGAARIEVPLFEKAGKYTLTIPEGTFYDAAYESSNGKGGKRNLALTRTYDVTVEQGGGGEIENLALTSCTITKADSGDVIEIKEGASLVGFGKGDVISATATPDGVGIIFLEVKSAPADGSEGEILRSFQLNKNAETGAFTTQVYGSGVVLDSEMKYTLTFEGIDREDVAPSLRKNFGTVVYTIQGAGQTYKYSDVKLVSVSPEPGTEITDPDTKFVYTFSAPVKVDEALSGVSLGPGGTESFKKIESSADGATWTITVNPSTIENCTPEIILAVGATDMNGLRLQGNNGVEDKSVFAYTWDCYLGAGKIIAVPVYDPELEKEGVPAQLVYNTVKEISGFYVIPGSGMPAGIDLGFTDAPRVESMSGSVVSVADFNEGYEKIFREADKDNMDAKSIAVRFKLKKAVTAPGKYKVVFPSKSIMLGTEFDGIPSSHYEYYLTIEGTPEVTGCSIEEGEALNKVGIVSFYTPATVEAPEGAKMRLENEEGNIASVDVTIASAADGTMIIGDFTKANGGKAITLENGAEYSITVPANRLVLTGTEMKLPKMTVNFTGYGAEYVSLTHSVSGHAMTVGKVVKGLTAKVDLTPATNWIVEKVTFNGTDVTDQVKDNSYTTPALDTDANVGVDMAYDGFLFEPVGVDEVVTDFNIRAFSEDGKIQLRGLTAGMTVGVYTLGGAAISTFTAAESAYAITAAPDTYIITLTLDGKTQAVKLMHK